MAILKKLVEFIRAKLGTFMTKNLTVEDQYSQAATMIIDEITKLRTKHVLSINEEKRLNTLADEKEKAAISKEREIRRLLAEGADVTTHAKLGLLYRRTAEGLRNKAKEYVSMRAEIESTVVALDNQRIDLSAKLDYIRETAVAGALGINTADDVVEIANLMNVKVQDILMKVDTFHSAPVGSETTTADLNEYLESLKA